MVVIINYGMGNLHSVLKAFKRLSVPVAISADPDEIHNAEKLVLPGVGHFKQGMKNLHDLGLDVILNEAVMKNKTPILGICLGMQLFTKHSEEGDVEGLGWFDAKTVKFGFNNTDINLKIPHIGWNTINKINSTPLFSDVDENASFYFVHSYHVVNENVEEVIATTEYGHPFISAMQKSNIFATQFHPEKSHDEGLHLLKNFIDKT